MTSLPNATAVAKRCDKLGNMPDKLTGTGGNNRNSAATHFGRQMRKEREAHGWTLRDLAGQAGADYTVLSRVETGKRMPTEALARACDRLFPERRGWFTDWFLESQSWSEIPAGFRSWGDLEERATSLRVWSPGAVDGLLQTEDYARALLRTYPDVTDAVVKGRLSARMERQRRVLRRPAPFAVWFIVDELALYRCVGSPGVMAAQCARLAEVAAMPRMTVQVLPPLAHPATPSGCIVTDDSAWCEHMAGGFAYTGGETVTLLARLFDTLRSECRKASESTALLERMADAWTGGSPLTQAPTAASA